VKGFIAPGALAAIVLTGCSAASPTSGPAAAPVSSTGAVRWWSDGADYCAVLRQTVAHKGGLLAGASAASPQLQATTRAFVAEITSVAPAQVARSWRIVGTALESLVAGSRSGSGDATAVGPAAQAIAADARSRCGLDLATPSSRNADSRTPSAGAVPRPVRSGG
jgi:hypothetical protein